MKLVPEEHYQNRSRFPPEDLAAYYGKEVAWSVDGLRIVASGEDPKQVCAAVRQAGLQPEDVVLAYIPYPEESMLGAAFLGEEE